MWQGLAKARLQRVLEQIIFNSVFFTEKKSFIKPSILIPQILSQLWLQSYASVIILWNLCISIYQFMNFNFTVVRSMSNAKPSHRVYHNPLQWNFWSRWCNISACNSSEFPHGFPDFHILYIIIFLPPILVISIFCNLSYFRLQFSRFPYSATYHVIFVCRLPGFHLLQLVRFLPVIF